MLLRAGADGPQGLSALAFFVPSVRQRGHPTLSRLRPTPSLSFVGPMVGVIVILVLLPALAGLAWYLRAEMARSRTESTTALSERNAEVDRRLQGVIETMDRRLAQLDTKVDRRLESASQTTIKIHERLGKVDEATTQM